MEKNPSALIIISDDFLYGIQKGYYPELTKSYNRGDLRIISEETLKNEEINLDTPPSNKGCDVYVLNPYSECYISCVDIDKMEDSIFEKKCVVLREALVKMGAKDIKIAGGESNESSSNLSFEAGIGGSLGMRGGEKKEQKESEGIKSKFSLSDANFSSSKIKAKIESHDPNRKPQDYDKVRDYIFNHGLGNDTCLMGYLNRFKEDGRMSGTEKYEVTTKGVLTNTFKILASVDFSSFDSVQGSGLNMKFSPNANFENSDNNNNSKSLSWIINFGN